MPPNNFSALPNQPPTPKSSRGRLLLGLMVGLVLVLSLGVGLWLKSSIKPTVSSPQTPDKTEGADVALTTPFKAKQLAVGQHHACALATDDQVYCWGSNQRGQLAISSDNQADSSGNAETKQFFGYPVKVNLDQILTDQKVTKVVAGADFSCVMLSSGRVYCWGDGSQGQRAIKAGYRYEVPSLIDFEHQLKNQSIQQLTAGHQHVCAVASDGRVYCWGKNDEGQAGEQHPDIKYRPEKINDAKILAGKTIQQLSAGKEHSCVLTTDGRVYCWGNGRLLGNRLDPTCKKGTVCSLFMAGALSQKTIKQLQVSDQFSCVIASDDQVYCWGDNRMMQLGSDNQELKSSYEPVAVETAGAFRGKVIKKLALGSDFGCAIASDDQVYCWGNNQGGKLTVTADKTSTLPTKVELSNVMSDQSTVRQIVAGGYGACAINAEGLVYCWGMKLSDSSEQPTTKPQQIKLP